MFHRQFFSGADGYYAIRGKDSACYLVDIQAEYAFFCDRINVDICQLRNENGFAFQILDF